MSLDKFFESGIEQGYLKAKPHSGKCMFCGKELTEEDEDHSVCNSCWDSTFAHKFIGEEENLDVCTDCGEEESHKNHQNWEKTHRDVEPDWLNVQN